MDEFVSIPRFNAFAYNGTISRLGVHLCKVWSAPRRVVVTKRNPLKVRDASTDSRAPTISLLKSLNRVPQKANVSSSECMSTAEVAISVRVLNAHVSDQHASDSLRLIRGAATHCLSYAIGMASFGLLLVVSTAARAAGSTITQYTYDAGDHITAVTDPRGLVTAYNYDGLGQLWGVSSPDTGITTASYDAYGRRSSMTRANNVTTTYSYDAINRLASVAADGHVQTFTYDSCTNGLGRLCSASDATGSTAYTYTPEGWVSGRGFSISGTTYSLGYGYDALGQLNTITYPDGYQANYSYGQGAVSVITFTMGSTQLTAASNVTWRPMDTALAGWTSSNGLTNSLSYDTDGRLTGITVPGVESLGYSYDAANRLTGIDNVLDGTMSQDFGYDDQSRLVSVNSANQVASYGYDANGNRVTTVTGAGTSNTGYSASSNRLVSTTGVNPQSYGYDDLGNLTTLNGATAYQYDAFNRMSAAGGSTYYVNPEGQRLAKAGGAGTTYFAPDVSGPLLAEYANGAWIDYVWMGGRLIGRQVNGQLEAIHDDQLGRPQVVTNASQEVVWSAQNWPFTRNVTVSNSVPLNLGFPGQYYDAETGLWNNGFRDYDPTLGRYVESDPLGLSGGINTYAYAGNNPLGATDPLGLICISDNTASVLGAGAGGFITGSLTGAANLKGSPWGILGGGIAGALFGSATQALSNYLSRNDPGRDSAASGFASMVGSAIQDEGNPGVVLANGALSYVGTRMGYGSIGVKMSGRVITYVGAATLANRGLGAGAFVAGPMFGIAGAYIDLAVEAQAKSLSDCGCGR
ncbi:RHS repeat domain-containing protein [Frateuria sp. YIM B11624]|uniref:RHS repeat domain-containing protein n=1 Tax=Frateuria sp. YIM B11624 TaxID=3143185 RepID=UPI003C715DB8